MLRAAARRARVRVPRGAHGAAMGEEVDRAAQNLTVASHYNSRKDVGRQAREASPIVHMKRLNNWVKATLIGTYTQRGDAVLDLASGKGGDLAKWQASEIALYVGADIAASSVEDSRNRYNADQRPFPARLFSGDAFAADLASLLQDDLPFDVVSCQFAFHYAFDAEDRARNSLKNIAALLRPGGAFIATVPDANVLVRKLRNADGLKFGNRIYSVEFDEKHADKRFSKDSPFGNKYVFNLLDAIEDCPEYLVPMETLEALAEEYGLQVERAQNFHEYHLSASRKPENAQLLQRMNVMHNARAGTTISPEEWEAARVYMVLVLRKKGNAPRRERMWPPRHFKLPAGAVVNLDEL